LERGVRPIGRLVDVDHLVEMLEPLDAVMRGRVLARAVELARDRLVERVDDERRLAAARDAGDAGEGAERDLGGDVLQIVAARADDAQRAPFRLAALRAGMGISRLPVRYCPVSEAGLAMISAACPAATISPPWMPAPGPMSTTWSAAGSRPRHARPR
jgi:hypothetical protein